MNVKIEVYVRYSGPSEGLDDLIGDIANVICERGFGVHVETDALTSLILLKESEIGQYEDPNDFTKAISKDSVKVIVPAYPEKEDNDEHTGD